MKDERRCMETMLDAFEMYVNSVHGRKIFILKKLVVSETLHDMYYKKIILS